MCFVPVATLNLSISSILSSTNTTFPLVTSPGIHPTPRSLPQFTCSPPDTHHLTGKRQRTGLLKSFRMCPHALFFITFHVPLTPHMFVCLPVCLVCLHPCVRSSINRSGLPLRLRVRCPSFPPSRSERAASPKDPWLWLTGIRS